MEAKFTPGPWRDRGVDKFDEHGEYERVIIGGDDFLVATVPTEEWEYPVATGARRALVNASLIAAAPDLYALLNEIEEAYLPDDVSEVNQHMRDLVLRVRAALARARGEER